MRIAFSARGLSIPSGGVHRFIKSLVPSLAKQRGDDELFILYNKEEYVGLAPGCNEIVIKGDNRIWYDFYHTPKMLRKLKIDAAIFPKNIVPFFLNCRSYVVIHDLAYFIKELNAYPFLDTLYMTTLLSQSVRRADKIFAVSENTKKDIVKYTKCDPEKILVTYEAAEKLYSPVKDPEVLNKVKQKYNLPNDFIMYVGSLSPRKNIIRLLEAFNNLRDKIPHDLILTGSKSWKDDSVFKTIESLDLAKRIQLLGYVENEDMPVLYSLSKAYIYISLYEGFGLPVLEAMQCGCPVVASNTTSIPEVAGDAAVLVNPLDVTTITDSLYKVLTDTQLRDNLIESGYKQAQKFSWDKCAGQMLENIRKNNSKQK